MKENFQLLSSLDEHDRSHWLVKSAKKENMKTKQQKNCLKKIRIILKLTKNPQIQFELWKENSSTTMK